MAGIVCDKRTLRKLKWTVFKIAITPAMMYGLQTSICTFKRRQELDDLEVR